MEYSVVIVAAGSGSRMHLGYNKVFYRYKDKTILERTMDVFLADADCKEMIVVTDTDMYRENICDRKYKDVIVVAGGKSRSESVYEGVKCVSLRYVMIHDGARCNITHDVLRRIKDALCNNDAVIPMVPVKDTIKIVQDDVVESTLKRDTLYAAQTPQAFLTQTFLEKLSYALSQHKTFYDDSMVFELYTKTKVKVVAGDYNNIKITTPEDLDFIKRT